jgi:CubicO group peptidase (beta-lactamase class C family)
VELLDAPGRQWLYSGGGYSVLQLLVEELTGRPFADVMQTEILDALSMTASSFHWRRTAATACPHDADGGRIPDFVFTEQAAAGLVTTAPDLARFVAAALPGPEGEPPGRGVLSPAGMRLTLQRRRQCPHQRPGPAVDEAQHKAVMTRRQPSSTATTRLPPGNVFCGVGKGSMVRTCHGERWCVDDRPSPSRP